LNFHNYFMEDIVAAKIYTNYLEANAKKTILKIESFLDSCKFVCFSLSFGKDSMTILQLLHESGLIDKISLVMFNHSGIETDDTEIFIDYVVEYYDIKRKFYMTKPDENTLKKSLSTVDFDAFHPMRDFVYYCLEKPRWELMDKFDVDGTILGLRIDESRGRKINYFVRGDNYYAKRELSNILTPIVKWRTIDIYRFAALRKIPFHPIYRKKARLGYDKMQIRHNTPLEVKFSNNGDMSVLKALYPRTFQEYEHILPQISNFL